MAFTPDLLAHALSKIRERQPVVHAITNLVTIGDVANALHALGARPVMASALEEVKEITSRADALVLNLGTPDPNRIEAMLLAGRHANTLGHPVILDPVGAGASPFRFEVIQRILLEVRLTVIRGNGAEIGVLAGMGGKLRGIDSAGEPADPEAAAKALAQKTGGVVVLSGPQDLIAERDEIIRVENGHPMMARVTGTGCMLSAIIGAFAAVERNPMIAATGAVAFFGLAGEKAAQQAKGPGSFKVALFDALFVVTPEDVKGGAKIKFPPAFAEAAPAYAKPPLRRA